MVNTRPVRLQEVISGRQRLSTWASEGAGLSFFPPQRASGIYNGPENQKEVPLMPLALQLFIRLSETQRVGKGIGLEVKALGYTLVTQPLASSLSD